MWEQVVNQARVGLLAVVTLSTAIVAIALLAADARRSWNRWLAAFLLLVCGNYGAQVAEHLWHHPAGLHMAGVFLTLDPFALAYFAAIFPRRASYATPLGFGLLAVSGAFAILAGWSNVLSPAEPNGFRVVFFVYLGACYLFAAWRLFNGYLAERSSVMAAQLRSVLVGVIVVTIPRVALLYDDLRPELRPFWSSLGLEPEVAYAASSPRSPTPPRASSSASSSSLSRSSSSCGGRAAPSTTLADWRRVARSS